MEVSKENMEFAAKLDKVKEDIEQGALVKESIRTILSWFDRSKRGWIVCENILRELHSRHLTTIPHIRSPYWVDYEVEFHKVDSDSQLENDYINDPVERVGRLEPARIKPTTVSPSDSLEKARTLMMLNEFSQLPVINGDREVKGIISWRSIAESLTIRGESPQVKDCIESHVEIGIDEPLFKAIGLVRDNDVVIVKDSQKCICGIITASDLNDQFRILAEPFLLVCEIENGVRKLLSGKFDITTLRASREHGDPSNIIGVSNLTFSEYITLINKDDNWTQLNLALGKKEFSAKLERVRVIRNSIMHFHPEGIEDDDTKLLREFASFLSNIRSLQSR